MQRVVCTVRDEASGGRGPRVVRDIVQVTINDGEALRLGCGEAGRY
ncbi:MAG: hypothetical protein ACTHN5_04030 [Phycisphaerae bacterium]